MHNDLKWINWPGVAVAPFFSPCKQLSLKCNAATFLSLVYFSSGDLIIHLFQSRRARAHVCVCVCACVCVCVLIGKWRWADAPPTMAGLCAETERERERERESRLRSRLWSRLLESVSGFCGLAFHRALRFRRFRCGISTSFIAAESLMKRPLTKRNENEATQTKWRRNSIPFIDFCWIFLLLLLLLRLHLFFVVVVVVDLLIWPVQIDRLECLRRS